MMAKDQLTKIRKEITKDKDRTPLILGALGDPSRFRIFKLLMNYCDICVTDIAKVLGLTASAVSQQLKILEMLGLVEKIRAGQLVCYELKKDDQIVKQLIKFIKSRESKNK